jgi:hypothetical protein
MESDADWKFLLTGLAAIVGMHRDQNHCIMRGGRRRPSLVESSMTAAFP